MSEELYVTVDKNGNTFKCVKSQLMKTGGKCPVWGHQVDASMAEIATKQKQAQVAKLEAELASLKEA